MRVHASKRGAPTGAVGVGAHQCVRPQSYRVHVSLRSVLRNAIINLCTDVPVTTGASERYDYEIH